MKVNANKIEYLMWSKLWTRKELAKHAGVSGLTISNTLNKGICSTNTARGIAAALGVKPIEIIAKGA